MLLFCKPKKKYAGIAVARPATPHIVTVRHHIFCPKFMWKIISTVALIMLLKSPPPFYENHNQKHPTHFRGRI